MNKIETADYLANIICILNSMEDAGIAKSQTLGREYNRVYTELKKIVQKEEEDEARKSNSAGIGSEGRAELEGSQPRRR
jgi:hypothetical protein